jgi:hypothetical protein
LVTVHRAGDGSITESERRSPVTVTDLGIRNAETLPKVNKCESIQEAAPPKFPAELMVTVTCSGEALQEPIQKERCDILAENVGDGILSNLCP